MSKLTLLVVIFIYLALPVSAADLEAAISLGTDGRVEISGHFASGDTRQLSLLLDYAGIAGLGRRFTNIRLSDREGRAVTFREMLPGEYLADGPFYKWTYLVDLAPLKPPSALAHVSWAVADRATLNLGDLLPVVRDADGARVTLAVPPGWSIFSAEAELGAGIYNVPDIRRGVFYLGTNLRTHEIGAAAGRVKLIIGGEWHFADDEAAEVARSIFAAYRSLLGADLAGNAIISLNKFAYQVPPGSWEAGSRGRSITLVSADTPFKTQSIQHLHEQLRHEIFHLWMPNQLRLTGSYDWFYEGFALYQSLKLGVAANQIRFDDYLDTLSRAIDIDRRTGTGTSLIAASKTRWAGSNTQVYARGMLVAFLTDIELMHNSRGRRSTNDLLRDIFNLHSRAPDQDGNTAVLIAMRRNPELDEIVNKLITGTGEIDIAGRVALIGVVVGDALTGTQLRVAPKLSGRQKDLLNKLGYNNWRRIGPATRKSK